MIRLSVICCLMSASCISPDTQPVIDTVIEWKRIEDSELGKHRELALAAKFSDDAGEQERLSAQYLALIDKHKQASDEFAMKLIDWSRKVGSFDSAYADGQIDKLIEVYERIRRIREMLDND